MTRTTIDVDDFITAKIKERVKNLSTISHRVTKREYFVMCVLEELKYKFLSAGKQKKTGKK
jgi:hypothetical protein